MPQTCDGTGQMHLGSNCCKNGQTLLQRTCHGVSCCGWWFQAARSILGKGPSAQSLAGWTLESEALRRDMGTWLLACICICTCVCLGVSVTGEGQGPRSRTFTCLTNNILRIDCHWSAPELGQGSSPWLLFTSNQAPGGTHKCILRGSECTVVLPPEAVLVPSDNFTITFHHCMSGREQVSLVDPEYLPRRHVKLDPPSDLQSNISSGHCILTWSISPALEPMTTLLSYELAFKKQEEAWETWMGAHGAGVLLSQDCAGTPQGALEPCVQEATALLTCGPARPWKSVALEEEQEGPGTRLPGNLSSEDVLPAGCTEWRVQTLAYLPQEDWAPTSLTRPAPPDSEGSRSSSSSSSSNNNNYCALGCYGGWHLSALPGNTQSSGPIPALACGLSCDHQGLETQQGVAWVLAGHCQRPGLHEDLQGMLLPSVLSKARSWTF
eukprot:XP_016884990.1 interleukin-9 receptor isoform X9 [Homo sapiens]